MKTTTLALGALALCSSCSSEGFSDPSPRSTSQSSAIIHGSLSGPEHDAVVLLVVRHEGGVMTECTGTMVAPNLVLTARHCVSETDEGALCRADGTPLAGGLLGPDYDPAELYVYTGEEAIARVHDTKHAAARGREIIVEATKTYCDRDVAFLLLDKSLSIGVAPIRLEGGAQKGELLTAVGWGIVEDGSQPLERRKRDGVRVEAIGPLVTDEKLGTGLAQSEFLVGEATCSGDSGGPTFGENGAVVGVISRGGGGEVDPANRASKCVGANVIGIYTHLGAKRDLIGRAFGAAGFEPTSEPPPVTPEEPEPAPPAPTEPAPPSSPPAAASTTETTTGDGCSSSPRAPLSSGALVVLAIAVAVNRRRGERIAS